jgi:putative ABC transport system substrate-binding protein
VTELTSSGPLCFFHGTFIGSLFAAPLTIEAQQAGRVPRIGALGGGVDADSPGWAGFRQGLRELGWEEGRNIAVEFRFTGGRDEPYRELAGELVRLNVDVLAASDSQAVRSGRCGRGSTPGPASATSRSGCTARATACN